MSEEERLTALLLNMARDGSLRIRGRIEAADLARQLHDAGVRLPATPEDAPSHAEHFDPDCEECAYLARPTRETLFRAATPEPGARLREALLAIKALCDAPTEEHERQGGRIRVLLAVIPSMVDAALAGHESTEPPRRSDARGSLDTTLTVAEHAAAMSERAEPPRPERYTSLDAMTRDEQHAFLSRNPDYQGEPIVVAEPPRPEPLIRATHPYGFRSGEWAALTGIEWANGRPCFTVRFPDGKTDSWVVYDPSDPYEFQVAEPPREDPQPQYPDTFDDLAGDPTSPPR